MQIIALVVGGATPSSTPATAKRRRQRRDRATRAATEGPDGPKPPRRRPSGPAIVKDLSLRPKGKTAFADFATEKAPSSHQQKQAVIIYWLKHEAGLESGITVDHVNTCYVEANGRVLRTLRFRSA
ncbi:MAG: hypothetical protein ACXVFQ_03375 [Solirubrobacteraceae bacterium]